MPITVESLSYLLLKEVNLASVNLKMFNLISRFIYIVGHFMSTVYIFCWMIYSIIYRSHLGAILILLIKTLENEAQYYRDELSSDASDESGFERDVFIESLVDDLGYYLEDEYISDQEYQNRVNYIFRQASKWTNLEWFEQGEEDQKGGEFK